MEESGWTLGLGDFGGAPCNGCHGYPPTTPGAGANTDHANTSNVYNGGDGGVRLLAAHGECDLCHGISEHDSVPGTFGTATTAGDNTYDSGTMHKDGNVQINGGGGANDADYDGVSACDAACHTAAEGTFDDVKVNTVVLQSYGGSCPGCHATGADSAPVIDYDSPHTSTDGTAGGDDCLGCHKFHDASGSGGNNVAIPTRYASTTPVPTMNNQYSTHSYVIQLGGSATATYSVDTEAEMCWGCHYTNSVSDEGEFGVNNNANTGGETYDYGSLSTWNGTSYGSWIGANWTSPIAGFAFKSTAAGANNGALQSMHAANFDDGASGNDTAANIRCSYCHDVHDTGGGTNNGQGPYLRGSWRGNPFPEDGAPYDGQTYPVTYDGGTIGGFPRVTAKTSASAYRNQYGGYQIEANNPTAMSGITTTNMAGLCEACHVASPDGTWDAAEINSINYFGTASADWTGTAGSNGHANSVLGGGDGTQGGPVVSQASNILNETIRGNSGYTASTSDGVGSGSPAMVQQHGAGGQNTYGFRGHTKNDPDNWIIPQTMDQLGVGNKAEIHSGSSMYDWGGVTIDASATIDENYHQFPCSKCHNPHASRLERLMITNCLDIQHETWSANSGYGPIPSSGNGTNIASEGISAANLGATFPQSTAANNCHREGDGKGAGNGWNNVTPWAE
jgi:hypothetical protein